MARQMATPYGQEHMGETPVMKDMPPLDISDRYGLDLD